MSLNPPENDPSRPAPNPSGAVPDGQPVYPPNPYGPTPPYPPTPYGQPTYPPSPYGQPQSPVPYPTPTGLRPRRRRPSGWWWLAPATLFMLALVAGGLFVNRAIGPFVNAEGNVPVDAQAHAVHLNSLDEHLLLVSGGSCTITDPGGVPLELREWGGDNSTSGSQLSHFTPTGYDVVITCFGDPAEQALVAPDPGNGFLTGIMYGVLAAAVLGGLGLVVTIVLIVLFATGAPRNRPAI